MIKNIQIKVVWAWLIVATVALSSSLTFIAPQTASAASNYTWAGSTQINSANPKESYNLLSGGSFCSSDGCIYSNFGHTGAHPSNCKVSGIPDPKNDSQKASWPSNINKIIQVENDTGGVNAGNVNTSAKTAILYSLSSGSGGNCNVSTTNIVLDQGSLTSPNSADYAYTDGSTIRNIHNGDTYKAGGDKTVYNQQYGTSDVKCPDYIKLPSAGATTGILHIATEINASQCEYDNRANSENEIGPLPITITKTAPSNIPADSHAGDAASTDTCAVPPETSMRWLSCDLITLGQTATEAMDRIIQNFLYTPPDQVFTDQLKTAWNSFRIIGVALVLIAGLIMVISQAAGFELFDAYTVKKVLPRLIVAAIGISLSWPLMKLAVTFFNDIGGWAHDLILFPFRSLYDHAVGAGLLGAAAFAVGLPLTIVALGPMGTIALIGTVILGVLVALLVLAIRQIVILMAVVMAPLAIAAYILPGTQKLWAFWKDAFITSLLMFPIITGFIAGGKAIAAVAASVTDSPELHLLSVLAYFAPYFLLPFAFKLAGGLMATIFSIANDRNKGAFDRLRKVRQESFAGRRQRAASNSLWSPQHKRANAIASWVADPGSNAVYSLGRNGVPGFRRGSAKIASHIEHARVEQSGKLFEEINKMGFNDKGLRALSGMHYGFNEPVRRELQRKGLYMKAPQTLEQIQEVGRILQEHGEGTEIVGGQALVGASGRLATLFQDPEMGKASVAAAGIMGLAAHGFASSRDLANAANALAGGTFRSNVTQKVDEWGNVVSKNGQVVMDDTGNFSGGHKEEAAFALSIASQAQLLGSRSRPEAKNGYGVMYNGKGEFLDGMVSEENGGGGRMSAVLDTFNTQDLASAKGGAIKAVQPEIIRRLQNKATDPERYTAMRDNLFSWAGPYSSASADVKAQALKIIERHAQADQSFASDWARYQRMEDPNARTAGGGAGGQAQGGGNAGGGGQGQ